MFEVIFHKILLQRGIVVIALFFVGIFSSLHAEEEISEEDLKWAKERLSRSMEDFPRELKERGRELFLSKSFAEWKEFIQEDGWVELYSAELDDAWVMVFGFEGKIYFFFEHGHLNLDFQGAIVSANPQREGDLPWVMDGFHYIYLEEGQKSPSMAGSIHRLKEPVAPEEMIRYTITSFQEDEEGKRKPDTQKLFYQVEIDLLKEVP